jgi:hypothetical protein
LDDTTGSVAINQSNVAAPPYNSSLTSGHKYTWWVAAVSSNNLFFAWSASQDFTAA